MYYLPWGPALDIKYKEYLNYILKVAVTIEKPTTATHNLQIIIIG